MLRKTVGPLHWFRSRLRLYAQLKFVGDNCVGHLSIASRKGNGKPIDSVCHGKAAKFEPAGQQRGITAAGSRFGDAKRDGTGGAEIDSGLLRSRPERSLVNRSVAAA